MSPREYILVTDPATQFPQILGEVQAEPNISIDTETTSIDVPTFGPDARLFGISIAPTPQRAYYLPLGHEGEYQPALNLDADLVARFMTDVYMTGVPVVYHNAGYDRSVLAKHLGLSAQLTSNYHDTVLLAHLMNENQPLGLKALAVKYLGVRPEVGKLDPDLEGFIERMLVQEERQVPNKLGRLYKKKFYEPQADWLSQLTDDFARKAGGAASYRYVLSLTQKFWSVFKAHDVEGYDQLPKPLDFRWVPQGIASIYASDDVMNTLALYRLWDATFFDLNPELHRLYREIEQPVDDRMTRATIQGIPTNRQYLLDMKQELSRRTADARQTALTAAESLITPGDERFNTETLLTSSKQLQTLLFDELGFPVLSRTEKGAPQTSKDVLGKLLKERPRKAPQKLAAAQEFIRAKLQVADLEKISGTYTDGLLEKLDEHDRIHPTYNVAGTVSGRMSSNQPNFQNMPRLLPEELKDRQWLAGIDIRRAFEAEPGYVYVDVDLI